MFGNFCIFIVFLKVDCIFCEWEIPEQLRPPEWLFEDFGGFSPFLGYFPLLKGVQNNRKWLYSFLVDSKLKPYTNKENFIR